MVKSSGRFGKTQLHGFKTAVENVKDMSSQSHIDVWLSLSCVCLQLVAASNTMMVGDDTEGVAS